MRGLYVHIPFCKQICKYCDFYKLFTKNEERINRYIQNLINELDLYYNKYSDIETIYIGGGTPNFLSNENLEKLLTKLDDYYNRYNIREYSIEINPDILTPSQVELFKKHHINRVSIGAQSFINDDLEKLGRLHNHDDIFNSVKLLKKYGINNINIDLIFAHPYDSLEKVKYNLEEFLKLDIPHISYYSMILEDKTVFSYQIDKGILEEYDQDKSIDLYEYIVSFLNNNGFHHYEISNFSKKGYESIHNTLYWDSLEYIGVGAGASGYLDSIRYTNEFKVPNYALKIDTDELSKEDKINEFFLLGLRKIDGVSIDEYKKRFNEDIKFDFKPFIHDGLIEIKDGYIKLTKRGLEVSNRVLVSFV